MLSPNPTAKVTGLGFGETTTFGQRPLLNNFGGGPSLRQSQRHTSLLRRPRNNRFVPGMNATDCIEGMSARTRNWKEVASYNKTCRLPNASKEPSGEKERALTSWPLFVSVRKFWARV